LLLALLAANTGSAAEKGGTPADSEADIAP
jgi:hypothetical protein